MLDVIIENLLLWRKIFGLKMGFRQDELGSLGEGGTLYN
jgi:hypothetical protein